MAEKYMLPMMRIICMAKTSEHYNYLPGEKEDPENLAGCYFDGELESVRENVRHCRCISPEMRKKLLELWKELREFVMTCMGVDALTKRWFSANPMLMMRTGRAAFYHDLKKEGAYELMSRMEFNEVDELVDLLRGDPTEEEEDEEEIGEVLLAFIRLSLSLIPTEKEAKEIARRIKSAGSFPLVITPEEKEKATFLCVTPEKWYWRSERPTTGKIGTFAYGFVKYWEPDEEKMDIFGQWVDHFGQLEVRIGAKEIDNDGE